MSFWLRARRAWRRLRPFLLKRSPWGEALIHTWKRRVTPSGRVVLICFIIIGSEASAVIILPLHIFALLLGVLLFVEVLARRIFAPRVVVHRDLPERCAAGARLEIDARLENVGRLPVFDLTVTEHRLPVGIEQPGGYRYLACLEAGAKRRWRYSLQASRRGVYTLDGAVALTAFPFGLYNQARFTPDAQQLIVYPPFVPLANLELPVGRKHQPGGLQLVSHTGDSEEFLGNREYRPGDRLRDVHYAAWARLGYPVVREFQQEYLSRIALVVDTFVEETDDEAEPDLEAALSLGAAVAEALGRLEYVIDLFAAGPDLYHFQAGRSLAHLDNILDILACIAPCRSDPFAVLTPAIRAELGQISTAVVVLLDWDERREGFVQDLRAAGVAVKAMVVRSVPPTLDPGGLTLDGGRVAIFSPEEVNQGVGRL